MAQIINGTLLATTIKQNIKNTIHAQDIRPGLAIVRVGDDPASKLYVKLKKRAAHLTGIEFHEYLLSPNTTEKEVLENIDWLNKDTSIHSIVVQLPLPKQLDEDTIIKAIDPIKDADGFHPKNIAGLLSGTSQFEPALAKTIFSLLAIPEIPLKGKRALIIANSEVFSKPIIYLLQKQSIKAEFIFATDKELAEKLHVADIVIVAVGKKNFIKDAYCKKGSIIIDIGINKDGKNFIGDVEPSVYETKGNIAWVTPVPGGVGPVTIAMLLTNVLELYLKQTQ